jgi:hypothetical protein
MMSLWGKKWPCPLNRRSLSQKLKFWESLLILAVYLVFATTGMYIFTEAAAHHFDDFMEISQENIFVSMDNAIDCQAEASPVTSRAGRYSFSPLRNGSLRITALPETHHAGTVFFDSSFKAITKTNRGNIKNNIPLKLRT